MDLSSALSIRAPRLLHMGARHGHCNESAGIVTYSSEAIEPGCKGKDSLVSDDASSDLARGLGGVSAAEA